MKKLLFLFTLLIILQSCTSVDTIENEKIDPKLRSSTNAKNNSLITAMVTSNLQMYYALESEEYRKQRQTSTVKPSNLFKKGILKGNFTVYDEFYVTNSDRYSTTGIKSEKHGYTFSLRNDKLKSYVSVLKVSGYQFDSLLAITYGLNDDGWKIYTVDLFGFGNWGKNVNDYYRMAKKSEEAGYLINAYNYAANASGLIDRADDVKLTWDNGEEIVDYAKNLEARIRNEYSFPLVLQNIHTKPAILSIEPRAILNSIVPTINYHSVINLSDTVQLKQEKNAIRRELQNTFKDLDFKATIVFRAFDDARGSGSNYYFIDKK